MRIETSHKISVFFSPWFGETPDDAGDFSFTKLHLYEELGGSIAYGDIDLVSLGTDRANELLQKQRTGVIQIEQEERVSYNIPVCITKVSMYSNLISLGFVCCKSKDFFSKRKTDTLEMDISSAIQNLYSGNSDIRCESDVQGSLKFYQQMETDLSLLTRLCYSYKKDSIFGLGWNGLVIKETFGEKNSKGNKEPDENMILPLDAEVFQKEERTETYYPQNYKPPVNVWEDTEGKIATQDYTQDEPINPRVIMKQTENGMQTLMMHKDYYQMHENYTYNTNFMATKMYSSIKVVDPIAIPKYMLGDVVEVDKQSLKADNLNWPVKYYLVKSNEFFISIDGSQFVDENGANFSWTSTLLGLEEIDGTVAIGSEEDPRDKEEK